MHYTPSTETLSKLHDAVLDIVAVINRPDRDQRLIHEAGIKLDRALFPLLVLTDRLGPIGVVELAGRVGRDHSTVSRQTAKLEKLGLVERRVKEADRRLREVIATPAGQAMARKIDAARERLVRNALAGWSESQVGDFIRAIRRYADALTTP